jgi:hypothetical protein
MKKTITLLAAAMIMIVAEAQASRLFLTTNSYRATANISGQQYFSQNGEFQINQLRSGSHFVRIRHQNNAHRNRNTRGNNSGHIFRGQIVIPHQSDVYARVTPRGRLIIDQIIPMRRSPRRSDCSPRQGRGTTYGRGQQYDNRGQRGGVRTPTPRGTQVQSNFSTALRMINQASFDSEKRSIAKQYLRGNSVTSQEVLNMIKALDYESSRLEIAKLAYTSTLDPENYFIVNKGFQFSTSANALDRHIA